MELSNNQSNVNGFFNTSESYKDLYKALFDQNHLPIIIVDPANGDLYDANPAAVEFYEYPKTELLTKNIKDINTLTKEEINQRMQKVKQEGSSIFYFSHLTKSGKVKDVKVDSIEIEINGIKFLYSIITDVTKMSIQDSFFQTLFQKAPYSIAILDDKYQIEDVNANFEELFQYKLAEIKGYSPKLVIYPEGADEELNDNIIDIETSSIVKVETVRKKKDGSLVIVELISFPIFTSGMHIATYAIYIDRTEKHSLEQQHKLLANVLKNNTEGVVITDIDANIEWVNEAFTKITGYSLPAIIGKNPRFLQSGRYSPDFYKNMWTSIETNGCWSGEIWNRNKQGELYPQWLKIFSIENEHNIKTNYAGVLSDFSEMKEWQDRVDTLIYKDSLTGLYNRFYITNCLESEIQIANNRKKDLVVIYCNLDEFKSINDTLGHSVGDHVLQTFTSKLLRIFDHAIIGRLGGDEFVIIINEKNAVENCGVKMERIFEELNKAVWIDNYEIFVSCSFGIAVYPKNGSDSDTILTSADIAMNKAKQKDGSSYEFFSELMKESVKREFEIKNYLHYAIENSEFELWYQPIVDLNTLKVIGSEALIRWHQPTLGFLSPIQFIPIAEKSGHIQKIGEWVLREACLHTKKLHEEGFGDQHIAVNVSVRQLENDRFAATVKEILEETDLEPRFLMLEVTEETAISDSHKVELTLEKLAQLGVRFAIDDFGTGYSSLEKLNNLKMNQLKIDQTFIRDLNKSKNIVRAILSMGKNLQLDVVSEGIETKEQLQFLINSDCDSGQGYLFSKPQPFADYKKFLINGLN